MTDAIQVIVGSMNPVKVQAARHAIAAFYPEKTIHCDGVAAPSSVAEQPIGEQETRLGAINRVTWCQQHFQADFYISMEGGAALFEQGPATFAYVVIANAQQQSVGRSANLPLPAQAWSAIEQGQELGDVMDELFQTVNIKQKGGAIGLLTNGVADRQSTYVQALTLAMAPFLYPQLYPTAS